MTDRDDKIDAAYLAICEKGKAFGIDSLNPMERAVRDSYYAWGLASNGGLHGLLFQNDESLDMGNVVEAYHEIGIPEAAQCVVEAGNFLLAYVGEQNSRAELDAEKFRKKYNSKLNSIEKRFYALDECFRKALFSALQHVEA